jgi:Aspartate/tyrosine/aromatic aminotransferase
MIYAQMDIWRWQVTNKKGMLSAFMGFIEDGDEVIIFEPFFDQ